MPSPVSFAITLAPLPSSFEATPQQLATAIIERLTIAPVEPWNSFLVGGAQPSSDSGPWLRNGNEWWVFNPITGSYTGAVQDGSGLVNASVPLTALAADTPFSLLGYDAGGRPGVLALGTPGQVLTATEIGPAYKSLVTGTCFELICGADDAYLPDGQPHTIQFNTIKMNVGVTVDLQNFRVPVKAGEVWFFYATVQIAQTNGTLYAYSHVVEIRPNGGNGIGAGALVGSSPGTSQDGASTMGVMPIAADGYVDVSIATSATTAVADGFTLYPNQALTRFGGFRLA